MDQVRSDHPLFASASLNAKLPYALRICPHGRAGNTPPPPNHGYHDLIQQVLVNGGRSAIV